MSKLITQNGKEYELQFPSLRRIAKLGELLGVKDILKEGIDKVDYLALTVDDEKLKNLFQIILKGEFNQDEIDDFTLGDLVLLVTGFFIQGMNPQSEFPKELKPLQDFMKQIQELKLPTGSRLTLQSSQPAVEIQK